MKCCFIFKTMQFRLSYQIAGNKAKKWISKRVFQENKARQFSEKRRFLVCASGGKKCLFFGKFGVLCFLGKTVLRFVILPYYRWNTVKQYLNGLNIVCIIGICPIWSTWRLMLSFYLLVCTSTMKPVATFAQVENHKFPSKK